MKGLSATQGAISSFSMRISNFRRTLLLGKSTKMAPRRFQSTSTMELVSMDEAWSCAPSSIWSTVQINTERECSRFPPSNSMMKTGLSSACPRPVEREIISQALSLPQAAKDLRLYDKIFLMVHQGEDEPQIPGQVLCEDSTDILTGRGVGQALSLSRRTAALCGEALSPDLVLVAPIRSVLQTAFLAFPYDTPYQSFRRVKWICYPTSCRSAASLLPTIADLKREFPGIDCSICSDDDVAAGTSAERLAEETAGMLDWLKTRHEKVVVGKL